MNTADLRLSMSERYKFAAWCEEQRSRLEAVNGDLLIDTVYFENVRDHLLDRRDERQIGAKQGLRIVE